MVGGDLYDLTMTQFGLRLIIGDVKGKGLDAVGQCAAVLALFREFAFAEPDLAKLVEDMDGRLSKDMCIEDFVTAIIAEFAPRRGAARPRRAGRSRRPAIRAGTLSVRPGGRDPKVAISCRYPVPLVTRTKIGTR